MVRATKAFLRFIGTCRDLNPLPPPTLPFFSPCLFGGIPECNTQVHPSPWWVPGRLLVASLFPVPSYLGVPGCFRHSWEPFSSSPGVSLDACVVAGNTFFSFPFLFFFLSSPLSLPLPRSRALLSHTHTQKRRCNRFSMRSGFIGSCPLHLVPFSSFPLYIHLFSSFLSCPPVFMSWHFTPSFFCAHIGPDLGVYAHIFTYF